MSGFDCIVSWLVFLHIPNKAELYQKCASSLKTGGRIYVEDYYKRLVTSGYSIIIFRNNFTERETELLSKEVFSNNLETLDNLKADLHAAGFKNIELIDMTEGLVHFYVLSNS